MAGIDLIPVAQQTLLRDLCRTLDEAGVRVEKMPWRIDDLTGDIEIVCEFPDMTSAVHGKLAVA